MTNQPAVDKCCTICAAANAGYDTVSVRPVSGKKMSLHCCGVVSLGQYGHLKLRVWFLAIFVIDTLHSTCPHGSSIGGFSAVLWSLDTGQAKMEWNTNSCAKHNAASQRIAWQRGHCAAGSSRMKAPTETESSLAIKAPMTSNEDYQGSHISSSSAASLPWHEKLWQQHCAVAELLYLSKLDLHRQLVPNFEVLLLRRQDVCQLQQRWQCH